MRIKSPSLLSVFRFGAKRQSLTDLRSLKCESSSGYSIPLLPDSFKQIIFGDCVETIDKVMIDRAVDRAANHVSNTKSEMPRRHYGSFPEVKLADMNRTSIKDHFHVIGGTFVQPIEDVIDKVLRCDLQNVPSVWNTYSGWTKYTVSGFENKSPSEEKLLVFDVEISVVTSRHHPVMATAYAPLSGTWYSWVRYVFPVLISFNDANLNQLNKMITPDSQKLFPISFFQVPRLATCLFNVYTNVPSSYCIVIDLYFYPLAKNMHVIEPI